MSEKMCQHQLWGEDSMKLAYMAELFQETSFKTMSKGFNGTRHAKSEHFSCRIKYFGPTKQSLKSLGQLGGSMCGEELGKELQPPASHKP